MTADELAYTGLIVAFDLDDTLYSELCYLKSGYHAVAEFAFPYLANAGFRDADAVYEAAMAAYKSGRNAFDMMADAANAERDGFIAHCVELYRYHTPAIAPYSGVEEMLEALSERGVRMAIVTDGRSRSQRNKIKALGIERFFPPENIIVSEEIGGEKAGIAPWQRLVRQYPNASRFVYVGDNPAKDFAMPRSLGWLTIGLRDAGENIHPQDMPPSALHEPEIWAENIPGVRRLLEEYIKTTYRHG